MTAALPAAAQPVPDCPLATTPYSIETPLIDLLIDPRARAVLDQAGILAKLPPFFSGTQLPTFSAIVSLSGMGDYKQLAPAQQADLRAKLAAIPIDAEATRRRCARYSDGPPPADRVQPGRPAILVFDRIIGFKDTPSVNAATAALKAMAARKGWQAVFTDNPGAITPGYLKQFGAVVWNNVSGDVLTVRQRQALRDYVEKGGGFVGFHGAAGDPHNIWDWYSDVLVSARFGGHPSKPQFQTARLRVEDPASPLTKGLGDGWSLNEEWYSFPANPRDKGVHVLLTIDEATYQPGKLEMGDHPIAWTRCVGNGRSFYSAIGHRTESYTDPKNVTLLENAIGWALGRTGPACRGGREVKR
ncbi:secreted glycosyl hydrolase [Sphingomonas spermidinifaciens]|uniref:Secreted glycosyl hydrolase n=2 Tax=Sphingomonas spermidinifaciens TaxID=1141889 RepID=A0A2A4B9B6_9SPHN|nr:secreted glycosyl hydrolase [Sphingomonas spermidinifaciens]